MYVSRKPHDGFCGRDLGKRACQDHPPTRLKHRLVSQNVLSKKAAPQMVASMGHFKLVGSYRPRRRLQYQKAVAESPSKYTEVFRLNPCLSRYTDTALTSLDSMLRAIPLLPPPSRRTLPLCPNQVFVSGAK